MVVNIIYLGTRSSQPSSLTRISALAAGVRGLMMHLKGNGVIRGSALVFMWLFLNALVNSALSLMIVPWSSTCGRLREHRVQVSITSLKCLPWRKYFIRCMSRMCWIYRPRSKTECHRIWMYHIGTWFSIFQIQCTVFRGSVKSLRVV